MVDRLVLACFFMQIFFKLLFFELLLPVLPIFRSFFVVVVIFSSIFAV